MKGNTLTHTLARLLPAVPLFAVLLTLWACGGKPDLPPLDPATVETLTVRQLNKMAFQPNSAAEKLREAMKSERDLQNETFPITYLTFDTTNAIVVEPGEERAPGVLEIDNLSLIMKAYPRMELSVSVTSGLTGDPSKDLWTARMRALSIKNRFIEGGIEPMRVEAKPFAAEQPTPTDKMEVAVIRR